MSLNNPLDTTQVKEMSFFNFYPSGGNKLKEFLADCQQNKTSDTDKSTDISSSESKEAIARTDHQKADMRCRYCDKQFKSKNSCKHHVINLHTINFTKPELKCKFCMKSFSQNRTLRVHLRNFHPQLDL